VIVEEIFAIDGGCCLRFCIGKDEHGRTGGRGIGIIIHIQVFFSASAQYGSPASA